MKKLFVLLFLIIPTLSFSEMIGPSVGGSGTLSGDSQIVVNSLWESSGHRSASIVAKKASIDESSGIKKKADLDESSGKIDKLDEDPDEVDDLVDRDDETDDLDDDPEDKDDLDQDGKKGESYVDRMKRKNREELKRKHGIKKTKGESAVERMKRENRERLKKMRANTKKSEFAKNRSADKVANKASLDESSGNSGNIFDLYKKKNKAFIKESTSGIKKLKAQEANTRKLINKKMKATYKRWKEARKKFLKLLPIYKKNTFTFDSPSKRFRVKKKDLKKPLSIALQSEYHLIPGSMDLKIRNQGKRPTCAAFTGIRAIETLLAGSGRRMDLSEQYFYWASKPKCQARPCKKRGSWVTPGFRTSKNSPRADIPLERNCPYKIKKINGNETQIPLKGNCMAGKVKIESYSRLNTLDEVVSALKENKPVMGGFKLSPNFYRNDGFIGLQNALLGGKMDSHAGGHAITIIGYMKLPKKDILKEGRICLIIANSWTEGWGRGGYSCISERWFRKYRVPQALVSLDRVDLR